MLNFNDTGVHPVAAVSGTLTLPTYGSASGKRTKKILIGDNQFLVLTIVRIVFFFVITKLIINGTCMIYCCVNQDQFNLIRMRDM